MLFYNNVFLCLQSYILMQFSQMSNFLYLMMTLVFYFYVLFCILVQRNVFIVINKNTSIKFLNKTDFRHHKKLFLSHSHFYFIWNLISKHFLVNLISSLLVALSGGCVTLWYFWALSLSRCQEQSFRNIRLQCTKWIWCNRIRGIYE